ncbi:MAG: class I SAM-dependent methyltransferase [Deinococcota bacterium]
MSNRPVQRPQINYRKKLLSAIASINPSRVLEVGYGGGRFLRSARDMGWELTGIDPESASIATLKNEGFNVAVGWAEELPYSDDSFDASVFVFTAHHIADWDKAVREAFRVSRAIFILDPWYASDIPSQAIALEFDRWCKKIDRDGGMIHNDCLSAGELLKPLDGLGFRLTLSYLLELQELGVDGMNALAEPQLRQSRNPSLWESELRRLQSRAKVHGFSDDGAILLAVHRDHT